MSEPDGTSTTTPPSTPEPTEQTTAVEPTKNSKDIICSRCGSKILLRESAVHVRKHVFLPLMTFKAAIPPIENSQTEAAPTESTQSKNQPAPLFVLPNVPGEVLEEFWLVGDMYTFENVGVSHTVNGVKYLTCADCEIGPIGFQNLQQKDEFYVALNRVAEK